MTGTGEHGLRGELAVVIGASSGIGATLAEALAAAGARLVLGGRDRARLAPTERLAAERGASEVLVETVDVRSPESIRAFAGLVTERLGPATVLVNSAGVSLPRPALEVTVEEWDATHDTQLRGVFFTCQAFGGTMAAKGYGKIVNLSSTWAATVGPNRSVYCAAKAGLSHLTAALAVEWAPLGIRVNAVAPTATRTPAVESRFDADPGWEDYVSSRIPLGRLAEPRDLVGATLFLASPASDFVTGHTLFVDGGWRYAK